VAVADGTGSCFSIDISGPGTVSRVPIAMISQRWGLPYLGWSVPFFQGSQWSASQMIKGVDVAIYQAESGWETGVDFAFMKVTQGTSYVNPRWVSQRDNARAAGLVVGYYHFLEAGNVVAQADYFLSKISLQPGDVLACDWETNPATSTAATNADKDAWIAYVQGKTGHRVVLYCNTDFWKNRDKTSFAGDGLWVATAGYPAGQPPITSGWLIHQYSTAGNIDHDVAQFSDRAAMLAWAGGDDVALSDADKTWINNAIKTQTTAVVKAVLASDAYGAVFNADKVRSPDDAPANPTWAPASYLRESYLRLLEVLAAEKSGTSAHAAILSQAQANGSNGTAANLKLDAITQTLAALDLSQLPAEIAAKLEALKITITEG
jgi:GH25 family lysozyme M1 (1,4-beta-N-acetylmuramidase)